MLIKIKIWDQEKKNESYKWGGNPDGKHPSKDTHPLFKQTIFHNKWEHFDVGFAMRII